jgi:hypothetical protein
MKRRVGGRMASLRFGICVAALPVLLAGCTLLNEGNCPSGPVVTVDAGTVALPADGAISTSLECATLCGGAEYRTCRLKDPSHVQCVPPCE